MKRIVFFLSFLFCHLSFSMAQTLEECQQAAVRNYPLIRQYDLIAQTTDLTVANIQKGWLPQISATAQATLQSDVTAWPDQMKTMMTGMGIDMKGLSKDQYRVGIDVSQTVFDGGQISSQKRIAREQGRVQSAQADVDLYHVRKRVNEMYFGLLLLDEQVRLNNDLQELLAANEKKLASMLKGGTASESDYNSVKAERLNAVQQATSLQAQRQALARMLSVFCGIEIKSEKLMVKSEKNPTGLPTSAETNSSPFTFHSSLNRPELRAIDAQIRLADEQEKALDAALMPKLGVFAQGFYGYPGYNLFEDMMNRKWSLNGMVGARLTWNIGALYTRKNDKARLENQRSALQIQRDVFLFNNRLEQIQQSENIERFRRLMAADDEIIALRSSIRKAAESKLSHGIIDVNDLVKEINAENAARVQLSIHEIEMLKEIEDLKFTTNNSLTPSPIPNGEGSGY